jgi:hypothetical protein
MITPSRDKVVCATKDYLPVEIRTKLQKPS